MTRRGFTAGFVALATAPAAAIAGARPDGKAWLSRHFTAHPLVGRIYDTAKKDFLTVTEIARRIASTRYVLLGETHPNPDHHALQAWALDTAAGAGRRPAVIIEMIPQSLQGVVDAWRAGGYGDIDALGQALKWNKRGWPDFAIYRPVFAAVARHRLVVRAGNVDRPTVRAVFRAGAAALGKDRARRLGLDRPLEDRLARALDETVYEAHCRMMPASMTPRMRLVQRLRDAVMAEAMLTADTGDGAFLIAGAGHTRRDWAVGAVLAAKKSPGAVLALAMTPLSNDLPAVGDYTETAVAGVAPHDVIWFTPRQDITDHCAALKERMNKKKTKGQ